MSKSKSKKNESHSFSDLKREREEAAFVALWQQKKGREEAEALAFAIEDAKIEASYALYERERDDAFFAEFDCE